MGNAAAAEVPQFLTPAQVVARWNNAVGVGTLANWRSKGKGPAYQKFGERVRYPLVSIISWEEESAQSIEVLRELKAQQANDNVKESKK